MQGLITDRDYYNVQRLKQLHSKSWENMTEVERIEWTGDPLLTEGANLIPYGINYSSAVDVSHKSDSITITATQGGVYLYAVMIVGRAADYENKTFTLSLDSYFAYGGCTPQIIPYWHDANGMDWAGEGLTGTGRSTFTTGVNYNNREYFALYVYATTDIEVTAGAFIRYNKLMLEFGVVRHEYTPYYEIIPTATTKGAYNYSDLNRVERAVEEIAEVAGYKLVTKTDRKSWDLPTESDLARYLKNLRFIRARFPSPHYGDLPVDMNGFTYVEANEIENSLVIARQVADATFMCGEIYCGEV